MEDTEKKRKNTRKERAGEGEGGTEFVISYFILQSLPC